MSAKYETEYSKGKKPSDILRGFEIEGSEDKKYAAKLIHKWKNEAYENMNMLALTWDNIDEEYAQNEIDSIGDDSEDYEIE